MVSRALQAAICVLVTVATITASAEAGDWNMHNVTDNLRGKVGIGATAKGKLSHSRGNEYAGELTVNCASNSTTVYIGSPRLIVVSDSASVEWRIDDEPIKRGTWNVCQSNDCVGLWNGAGIPFVKSMVDKTTLRVIIHRRIGGPVDGTFQISGGATELRLIGIECGWWPKK